MNNLNFHEYKTIQKAISLMSQKELSIYLNNIYAQGMEDAKRAIGCDDSELFVWDEEQFTEVLKRNHLAPELIERIIAELEV